jgi:hypothetical protein
MGSSPIGLEPSLTSAFSTEARGLEILPADDVQVAAGMMTSVVARHILDTMTSSGSPLSRVSSAVLGNLLRFVRFLGRVLQNFTPNL